MSACTTMPRPARRPRVDESPELVVRNERIIELRKLGVPVPTIARIEAVSERTVYRVLAQERTRAIPRR